MVLSGDFQLFCKDECGQGGREDGDQKLGHEHIHPTPWFNMQDLMPQILTSTLGVCAKYSSSQTEAWMTKGANTSAVISECVWRALV